VLELTQEELTSLKDDAHKLFISKASIDTFVQDATSEQVSAVRRLIHIETASRAATKKIKLMRRAKFPVVKSLGDFDYSDIDFPDAYTKQDIESLDFVRKSEGFVFYGKTGRGKTHLAIALGIAAVEMGCEVRFFGTAQLVRALTQALKQDTLEQTMREISRADLVILDEFGYIPLDIDGARLLFQVISQCYERQSLILTTNIEFSKWGTIFADEKLAAAAIDRICHHGRLLKFGGGSRRIDSSLMLQNGAAV
jgi:DNA replication protein DnaC